MLATCMARLRESMRHADVQMSGSDVQMPGPDVQMPGSDVRMPESGVQMPGSMQPVLQAAFDCAGPLPVMTTQR